MAEAGGDQALGVMTGGAPGDDAQSAAALRAVLHQHHLRWRAKKAKLKEQAQVRVAGWALGREGTAS